MNGVMRPIPFPQLVNRVQSEYKSKGSVFGIKKENFFQPSSFNFDYFGTKISAPIGPSAGPGTQLAQNILASFLAGGRIIELKTVQTMDGEELRKAISRPNINAREEGYNTEWSTELTIAEALEEYIKGWFLCHIFAVEYNLCEKADAAFTMSAGYSLEGIKSEKIDFFIEGMRNAVNTEIWQKCYEQIASNKFSFSNFTRADLDAVSPEISNSIIISTFYNCPIEETEKIASYIINEKRLNTLIKCNPTLLGLKTSRHLLDIMDYTHITISERHFNVDTLFNDTVKILKRLKTTAAKNNTGFGVKLTNTLPVEIKNNELPGKEMYLSGRALFPLSIYTAKKIADTFRGELPISYSGGADSFNLKAILETGIKPVTMVTTILKPTGYERFTELAQIAQDTAFNNGKGINLKALNTLCETSKTQAYYKSRPHSSKKLHGKLPVFDCAENCLSDNVQRELCVEVCPNRANFSVESQIVHIDSMCNECGNCKTFCPYEGHPCKDKLTIFSSMEDFEESQNSGFYKKGDTVLVRLEDKSVVEFRKSEKNIPQNWETLIKKILSKYSYLLN